MSVALVIRQSSFNNLHAIRMLRVGRTHNIRSMHKFAGQLSIFPEYFHGCGVSLAVGIAWYLHRRRIARAAIHTSASRLQSSLKFHRRSRKDGTRARAIDKNSGHLP